MPIYPRMPLPSIAILHLRDFRHLLAGRMFAMMSLQAQAVIVGWQVYSLTKDPFMLGLTGLAEAVPAIISAFFAGHIVDISRPQRVYVLALTILALNATGLFLIAGGIIAPPTGSLLIWIFAGIILSGFARGFIMPSSFALFPQIVPRAQTAGASAWMSSGFQMASIAGPAIAGLVYGGYGETIAWTLPLGMSIIALIMIAALGPNHGRYRGNSKREPVAKSIKAGWSFVLNNPTLLSIITLDMFAVLFGGAVAMLPAYADQILHVGSEGLGLLRAAPAMGAIITALFLAIFPMKIIRGATLLWVVAGFGLCMIGFGLSTIFGLSMLFLALSGAFDSVSMVIRQTLTQLLTPDEMRGRVSSVNSMVIISSNELGAFESGVAAKFLGLVPSVVLGGVATLLVVGVTAILSPTLRRTRIDPNSLNKHP